MKRGRRGLGGNSFRASATQTAGGAGASYLHKQFVEGKDTFKDSPMMGGLAIAVLGHVVKKYNANLGAGICGGAGVLAHQAYEREQEEKKAAPVQGVYEAQPRVGYGYADGVYRPVN